MPEEATPSDAPAGQPTPDPAPEATPQEPKNTPEAGDPPKGDDEPLGEGGKKALQAEREARKQLEKQLQALAPLQKVADALGGGDPEKGTSEIEQLTERLSQHEQELATERQNRWRAELANAHGFTAEQAAELRGETREELEAHAQRLKQLFPAAPTGTPRPDPSQGGRGGAGFDIDARIAEAQSKGDFKTVISLQNQKLAEQKR